MPLVLISAPVQLNSDPGRQDLPGQMKFDGNANMTCLFSFLSADNSNAYYVCEIEDVESVRQKLKKDGIPDGIILEVSEILPGTLPEDTLRNLFSDILYRYR